MNIIDLYFKIRKKTVLLLSIPIMLSIQVANSQENSHLHKLWYEQPAKVWMESIPLGNGRIGANVFGDIYTETIALNEITMWSGDYDTKQQRTLERGKLAEIRKAFFDGNLAEGNRLGTEYLAGTPHSFGSHVPLGDLKMQFAYADNHITDYKRVLDLHTAINEVTFKAGDVRYIREYLCSNTDDALIINLSADKAKSINVNLSFALLREADIVAKGNAIEIEGQVSFPKQGPGGVNFKGKVAVKIKEGTIEAKGGVVSVKDASQVTVVFDVRTDYSNVNYQSDCMQTIEKVLAKDYNVLRKEHIADHAKLYDRVDLYLGSSANDNLPTDKRWKLVKNGGNDVGLDALFFNFARYLLIASSRENSPLPANLQGIWNDNLACNMGWTNDYHLDINTQQNYWLANVGNLPELNKPLFDYIAHLAEYGSKTASEVYGTRGWTAHTVANVWGYTASGAGVNWGLFPTAGSWIASHLWTQYLYTLDQDFLRNTAYPLLKSNAEFLMDYMVKDPKSGYLMTGPSTSPENSFRYKGDELALSMMPTSDRLLVWETLTSCIEASKVLGLDTKFRADMEKAIKQLPPYKIGKNGGLQEWFDDFDEAQPNHRHTTHLLGLYPFHQITPVQTPDLAEAAQRTMELRLAAKGWEDVEWSRANMICNYARLYDAENAYNSVVLLQRNFTRENLLTISPEGIAGAPYDIFIFDGNEAGGAGIAEMLVQSHEGCIEFLPALPKAWKDGYFKGLSVRGGANVDLQWRDSRIEKAKITAAVNNSFTVKSASDKLVPAFFINGKQIMLKQKGDGYLRFTLKKGDVMELVYRN